MKKCFVNFNDDGELGGFANVNHAIEQLGVAAQMCRAVYAHEIIGVGEHKESAGAPGSNDVPECADLVIAGKIGNRNSVVVDDDDEPGFTAARRDVKTVPGFARQANNAAMFNQKPQVRIKEIQLNIKGNLQCRTVQSIQFRLICDAVISQNLVYDLSPEDA